MPALCSAVGAMKFLRPLVNFPRVAKMGLMKNSVRTFVRANCDSAGKQKKPFCAILTSPKKPQSNTSPVELDEKEFRDVFQWLKTSDYFDLKIDTNAFKMSASSEKFKMLVHVAFRLLLYPPFSYKSHSETVLLYLTGHGLDSEKAKEIKEESNCSSPSLDDVGISKKKLQPAAKYINPQRTLKGGEFDLGKFGYCDLKGLLEPWITALTRSPWTKNKHLIVIADSCYSGVLAEDLQQLALKEGPWNQNGCTVTVQSACCSDEVNFYEFTECFVHFNKPENYDSFRELEEKWNGKSEKEKNVYRQLYLVSPQLATTMPMTKLSSNEDCSTMEFLPNIHGFQLNLFRDTGFFKFCYLSHLGVVGSDAPALSTLKKLIHLMMKRMQSCTWWRCAHVVRMAIQITFFEMSD